VGDASAKREKMRFAAIGSTEDNFIVDGAVRGGSIDDPASSRPDEAAQAFL